MLDNSERCIATVLYGSPAWRTRRCSRKNGHGPDGQYCRQHDPVANDAKREAQMREHRDRMNRKIKARETAKIKLELHSELVEALKIAKTAVDGFEIITCRQCEGSGIDPCGFCEGDACCDCGGAGQELVGGWVHDVEAAQKKLKEILIKTEVIS